MEDPVRRAPAEHVAEAMQRAGRMSAPRTLAPHLVQALMAPGRGREGLFASVARVRGPSPAGSAPAAGRRPVQPRATAAPPARRRGLAAHVEAALRVPALQPRRPAAAARSLARGAVQPSSREYERLMAEAATYASYPSSSSSTTTTPTAKKGIPSGYVSLAQFNKTVNVYGKYSGLKGTGVDENSIYVKLVNIKGKGLQPFLWWAKPAAQVDDFVYTGSPKEDIEDCEISHGSKSGYTWHHTGDTENATCGTMQLVPTDEHSRLSHYGGSYLAYGYNE